MKHIHTFADFSKNVNEGIRMEPNDKLLDKMTIHDFDGKKWELNAIESDNELDPNSEDAGKEVCG